MGDFLPIVESIWDIHSMFSAKMVNMLYLIGKSGPEHPLVSHQGCAPHCRSRFHNRCWEDLWSEMREFGHLETCGTVNFRPPDVIGKESLKVTFLVLMLKRQRVLGRMGAAEN